jgi:hypothetical protein
MLAVLGTDVVLIILSVLMINLSENGQYPLWWVGCSWGNGRSGEERVVEKPNRWRRASTLVLARNSNDENVNNEEPV